MLLAPFSGALPKCISYIEDIFAHFRLEVMLTLKNGSYNGMWGVLGMSGALQMPVFSVYPKYGGFTVRKDLNTLVMPRVNAGMFQDIFLFL